MKYLYIYARTTTVQQHKLQYRNVDLSGVHDHDAIALKELKMAHRNQTIITGGLIENYNIDGDVAFDFGQFDELSSMHSNIIKRDEPMELDPHRMVVVASANGTGTTTLVGHSTDTDTTMMTVDVQQQQQQRTNGMAIRPTTLNLSGGNIKNKKTETNLLYTIFHTNIHIIFV